MAVGVRMLSILQVSALLESPLWKVKHTTQTRKQLKQYCWRCETQTKEPITDVKDEDTLHILVPYRTTAITIKI